VISVSARIVLDNFLAVANLSCINSK